MDSKLIITKFAIHGFNVHPSVVELLKSRISPDNIDFVIEHICKTVNSFIITEKDVKPILDSILSRRIEIKRKVEGKGKGERIDCEVTADVRNGVRVRDITGRSSCVGSIEDFVAYFNSRLEKLSKILRKRISPIQIGKLKSLNGERVEIIGIVNSIRDYGNYAIVELEDKTGITNVIAYDKVKEQVSKLLGDEIVGVVGTVRGRSVIADRLIFPDVPVGKDRKSIDFGVVFISDTHFGSKEFLQKEWDWFTSWLNGELGEGKVGEIAERIRYVVIAGDVVDGVGVYPEQEKDLEIRDIYGQYEFAAEQLEKIPKDIKIILSVGNHDAIRQAEPQPALPKEYRDLFPNNVIHVGNPAYIDLDGLNVLIYHGRSLDDIITKLPGLDYSRPHEALAELLKRRHLCPKYGEKVPIAPEREDWLVIDEIPDVLHCGHIHTYGVGVYRGVYLVTSSTWQSQTEFQRKVNLNPMPGIVAVYIDDRMGKLKFYDERDSVRQQ